MKIRKNGFLKTGGIMSLVLAAVIVTGFFWTPYGTTAMNAAEKTLPPSLHHLLGTDNFGRDVLSRVISELPDCTGGGRCRMHRRCADRKPVRLFRRDCRCCFNAGM